MTKRHQLLSSVYIQSVIFTTVKFMTFSQCGVQSGRISDQIRVLHVHVRGYES